MEKEETFVVNFRRTLGALPLRPSIYFQYLSAVFFNFPRPPKFLMDSNSISLESTLIGIDFGLALALFRVTPIITGIVGALGGRASTTSLFRSTLSTLIPFDCLKGVVDTLNPFTTGPVIGWALVPFALFLNDTLSLLWPI